MKKSTHRSKPALTCHKCKILFRTTPAWAKHMKTHRKEKFADAF